MSIATPFSLYRRSDIYIRHYYNPNSDINVNEDKLSYINSFNGFTLQKTVLDSDLNIYYWSFKCETAGVTSINIDYMPGRIHEFILDRKISNYGTLRIRRNSKDIEVIDGPTPLRTILPRKLEPGDKLVLWVQTDDMINHTSTCEIFQLEIYYYNPINCYFRNYSPPKATTSPKLIEVINGYNAYQTTQYINTEVEVTLLFYNESDHTDFVKNADEIHLLCDEKGQLYRGVVELKENKWLGEGIYEQKIIFKSPYKLGEGWD